MKEWYDKCKKVIKFYKVSDKFSSFGAYNCVWRYHILMLEDSTEIDERDTLRRKPLSMSLGQMLLGVFIADVPTRVGVHGCDTETGEPGPWISSSKVLNVITDGVNEDALEVDLPQDNSTKMESLFDPV